MARTSKTPAKKKTEKPKHPLMVNDKDWDREKVMDIVCDAISTSSKSVGTILSGGFNGNTLPSPSTFLLWLSQDAKLSEKYARAKEQQSDYLAEEMLEISDDGKNDYMERIGSEDQPPGYVLNGEHVQRSRLRIETRKWLMGKLKPKKYGEKLALTDGDGKPLQSAPPIFNVTVKGK